MDYTRPPEEVLELCPNQPYTIFPHDCANYFIDFKNANHVEFTDQHGGTIDIMRDGAHAYATNELAPDPSKSVAYNAGFSAGYLGLPLKGHHTQQYLLIHKWDFII